jgi:uracil-DNA glycosylase
MLNIHSSWTPLFEKEVTLLESIEKKICENSNKSIYPFQDQRFRVFEMDLQKIRIVLLGQDPYHGVGQAMGLSFSVPKGVKIPPSLVNIYKEIKSNFPERNYQFHHGDLTRWYREEGIFLLNAALSVEAGKPGSHLSYWEPFTNAVIQFIAKDNPQCIFLFLGNYAIGKSKFMEDSNKNRILSTSHPSPLGAYKGFLGSKIFQQCEAKLGCQINWVIDE